MLCKIYCAYGRGLEVFTVTVEVDVSEGIAFYLVGLPDNAVKESQQRISCALAQYKYRIPGRKIVINLAPANLKKGGSAFDAAIAIGIIQASGQVSFNNLDDFVILGELALDGTLRPVKGALPIIIHAKQMGFKGCILPYESAIEGCEIDGITLFGARTIGDVIEILDAPDLASEWVINSENLRNKRLNIAKEVDDKSMYDFKFVKGQHLAKKGLEIAAAGGHNVIMVGSPGSGKTLMAKCFSTILPKMGREESIETSKIYSVAGLLNSNGGLITKRPFREPHHTSTVQALAGSGINGLPGEISLAHNGVLFLDEFAEFPRYSIEILRQPLEEGQIQICRAKSRICYPASFMLVAAMNPCPCGYLYEEPGRCRCSTAAILKYSSKVSGPILDRIDIQLNVMPVKADVITMEDDIIEQEGSSEMAERVAKARVIQQERYRDEKFYSNANIPQNCLSKYCKIGKREQQYLKMIIEKNSISARGYSRILKISRTIADLDGAKDIELKHISQAIQFRVFAGGVQELEVI